MSGQKQHGNIQCPDFEVQLSDYLDGYLHGESKQWFEAHAAECAPCRELMEDARSAMEFLERVPDVEAPPDLVTRIVYHAPEGKIRKPYERRNLFGAAFSNWLMPSLQPRFAMGMAMTILSFAMLGRCTGVHITQIKATDLNPLKVWQNVEDRAIRTKDRAVKSYENLRFVYEIRSRINELEEQRNQVRSLTEQNETPAMQQKQIQQNLNQQDQKPESKPNAAPGQSAVPGMTPVKAPQKTGGSKQ